MNYYPGVQTEAILWRENAIHQKVQVSKLVKSPFLVAPLKKQKLVYLYVENTSLRENYVWIFDAQ